jgi:hypothetical protein
MTVGLETSGQRFQADLLLCLITGMQGFDRGGQQTRRQCQTALGQPFQYLLKDSHHSKLPRERGINKVT